VQPERAALLQAIFDHPEDDGRRLVYADWLAEHGDEADVARAEYVRLALARARLPEVDDRHRDMRQRMKALAQHHRTRWFPASPLLKKARLRRGFISYVRSPALEFNRQAEELFAVEPVTAMYVERGTEDFANFAANPLLSRFRKIDFSQGSLPPTGLAQLTQGGHLPALEDLSLWSCPLTHDDIAAFVRGRWPRLRRLFFHRCDLDDADLEALSRLKAPLDQLLLSSLFVGPDGVRYLLRAPWIAQLVNFQLVSDPETLLGKEGVAALFRTPQLANLRRLDLSYNSLGAEGVGLVAGAAHLQELRRLHLADTEGGTGGFLALCRSRALRQLRDLTYSGNGVNFEDFASEQVPSWPELRMLFIAFNPLGDQGVAWLTERGVLDRLRELWIGNVNMSGVGFLRLLRSPAARSLGQWENSSSDLSRLDDLPTRIDLPRLREWDLSYCRLGGAGGARLVRALRAPHLRDLALYRNDLDNATVHAVASNSSLRRLEKLSLSYHRAIDDEGVRLLCESPYLDRLIELQLFETGVSKAGLRRLRKRFRHVRH
jgi:uncharacterized protein (TIGR02996 family)